MANAGIYTYPRKATEDQMFSSLYIKTHKFNHIRCTWQTRFSQGEREKERERERKKERKKERERERERETGDSLK